MKTKTYLLKLTLLIWLTILPFAKETTAFDPLSIEKETPIYFNQTYVSKTSEEIEKETALPDLSVKSVNIFETINLVLSRNSETKISWLTMKQQAANYGISMADYLPSVTLSASHNSNKTDHPDTSSVNTNGKISLQWLLFDFGKRKSDVDKEYFALLQLIYQHNETLQNLIYQTIQTYCNLYASKNNVSASLRSEESYKTAYKIAETKYKLGLVPKADVLKAKTQYAQSSLNRQKAENTTADYKGELLKLLNAPQGINIELEKPELITYSVTTEQNVEKIINKLIDEAVKTRPDIKALIAKEKSYKASKQSTALSSFPKIFLYESSELTDRYGHMETVHDNSIGITVSVPLFTGFQQTYNQKRTEYIYQSVKYEKEKIKNETAYEVWCAYNNLKTAKQNIEASKQMLTSALENKNLTFGMYKAGKSNMLEVLEAESSYANAEKERITSEYNKFISEAALLKAIGSLNIESIK